MQRRFFAVLLAAVLIYGVLPLCVFADENDVNLVSGLEYTVETGEPILNSLLEYSVNGAVFNKDEGLLTDSATATLSQDSPDWFRAYSGKSRIITFDLGNNCRISGVNCGFLHSKAAKIYAPRYIKVFLSENGNDYELVHNHSSIEIMNSSVDTKYSPKLILEKVYSARYVKIEFCTDYYTYCDEIQVMGRETLSGDEEKVKADPKSENSGYIGSVGGYSDIVKLYNGYYPKDPSVGVLTEAEIMPYVAYMNTSGEIVGRMFDSILLSPCDVSYPSGGKLDKQDGFSGALMSDWELYLEHTFTAGQDLSAINKAVGKVNKALGTEEKLGIFLTVPYPAVLNKPFGDLDKNGVNEYCRTLEDRTAIAEWYIDKCIDDFITNNYENLVLAGFYWNRHEINYTDSDHEDELLHNVNDYIRKKGFESVFSANYLASGFDSWEDFGFDGAVMQADVQKNGGDPQMLSEFAYSVYNNRLGAEIQTHSVLDFLDENEDYFKYGYEYESHLYYGSKMGYMGALNIYEQGMGPGVLYEFCYADTSTPKGVYLRRLYDRTYRYIKGNYNNVPPTLSVETEVELVFGDTQVTLDLGINDVDSHWENLVVEFVGEPRHGRVASASDKKTLIYNVDEDYVGEDSFIVCISDGFNRSEEITVKVKVIKPETPEVSVQTDVSVTLPPSNPKSGTPVWLIILLIILAAAMIVVAVVTIVKPKKE